MAQSDSIQHLEEDALKDDVNMKDKIFTWEHQNKLPNQKKLLPQLNKESTI